MYIAFSFKMNVYEIVLVFLVFVKQHIYARDVHLSKWISIENDYPWKLYNFEIILEKGVENCIENCKAKKSCEYVNFDVRTHACFLVAINTSSVTSSPEDNVEKKAGFCLGRKSDWNMDKYEVCSECKPHGICKTDEQPEELFSVCQRTGCEPPENKPLTVIRGNMFSSGNVVKYQCKQGYTDLQDGNKTAVCQMSGSWTPTEIECKPNTSDATECFQSSCYLLDRTNRNWTSAKLHCESLGGYLTDIKTEQEWIFIRDNLFLPNETCYVWFGGNDEESEGNFIWLDGTSVSDGYNNWASDEPNNLSHTFRKADCMIYVPFYQNEWRYSWHDTMCSLKVWSVCEFS